MIKLNNTTLEVWTITVCIALLIMPNAIAECESCDEVLPTSIGMKNPAAVYCTELGYGYETVRTEDGERGICVIPENGKEFDAWRFLEGKVGGGYSYCVVNGYDMVTVSDGKNPFSFDYALCVPRKVSDYKSFTVSTDMSMSVTDLMNMEEKVSTGTLPAEEPLTKSGVSWSSIATFTSDEPGSFDWRDKDGENWVTPVKNQGGCGSCWAFATVAGVEAKYNIYLNNPNFDLDLSEQYLVSDCFDYYGNCYGGVAYHALEYIRDYGITDETCYPYTATNSLCSLRCPSWNESLWTIDDFGSVVTDDVKTYLVESGPLSTFVSMTGNFTDGIYECGSNTGINHAVLLVGYNDTGGYWIAKNSWGTSWGDDGYFKIRYDSCGINSYESPFYVNISMEIPDPIPLPTPQVVPTPVPLPVSPQIPYPISIPTPLQIPNSIPLPTLPVIPSPLPLPIYAVIPAPIAMP